LVERGLGFLAPANGGRGPDRGRGAGGTAAADGGRYPDDGLGGTAPMPTAGVTAMADAERAYARAADEGTGLTGSTARAQRETCAGVTG